MYAAAIGAIFHKLWDAGITSRTSFGLKAAIQCEHKIFLPFRFPQLPKSQKNKL